VFAAIIHGDSRAVGAAARDGGGTGMSTVGTNTRSDRVARIVRNTRLEQIGPTARSYSAHTPDRLLWATGIIAFALGIVAFVL
jgi:hypothetical protein